MTEKRQISQGYIIRILQHFATKLRNITNFVLTCLDQNFTQKGKGSIQCYFPLKPPLLTSELYYIPER
jgi:hypothetical protein